MDTVAYEIVHLVQDVQSEEARLVNSLVATLVQQDLEDLGADSPYFANFVAVAVN